MNAKWKPELLAYLKAMKSGAADEWSVGHVQIYSIVLETLGEEWSTAAVRHSVLTESWRPSPARLREIAATLASPVPTVDDAYAEVMDRAENDGLFCARHPDRPNVTLEGPPEFSHPLVRQAVEHCGGWRAICTGEANFSEGLSKQFRAAYGRGVERWVSDVATALSLPDPQGERPGLFPAWKPYRLPAGHSAAVRQIAAVPEGDNRIRLSDYPARTEVA